MMLGMTSTQILMCLGVLVAGTFLLFLVRDRKPKRAEKWEKAEIMRQLLALSEQENGGKKPAPSVRLRPSPTKPAVRPGTANLKASTKTNLPARTKVR
jgi:hypothetical protein